MKSHWVQPEAVLPELLETDLHAGMAFHIVSLIFSARRQGFERQISDLEISGLATTIPRSTHWTRRCSTTEAPWIDLSLPFRVPQ
jgi:hypothetical protein